MPSLQVGDSSVALEVPPEKVVGVLRAAQPHVITDVGAAMHIALETPLDFPTLRRAFTPDDHVAILIREDTNTLPAALQATLKHVMSAGVALENITILVPPRVPGQPSNWAEQVPEALCGFRVEEHRHDPKYLAYLASTKAGRRIYLNRTLVDADQVIILGPVRFDPFFGVGCGLADLFPTFSDSPTIEELHRHPHIHAIHWRKAPEIWEEAEAVGWLLGMPFVIAIVEGAGDNAWGILAGGAAAVRREAEKSLRAYRELMITESVDLAIGTISTPSGRQKFSQVTNAALHLSHAVKHGGRLVVLSAAGEALPPGAEIMRKAETPVEGLSRIRQDPQSDPVAWWQLASALEQGKIYLQSQLPEDVVESLFMVPVARSEEVQNLIRQAARVLIVEDAHQTWVRQSSKLMRTSVA